MTKFGLFIVFFAYSLMSILALAFACKLNMTGLTSSEPEAQVNTAPTYRKHIAYRHEEGWWLKGVGCMLNDWNGGHFLC